MRTDRVHTHAAAAPLRPFGLRATVVADTPHRATIHLDGEIDLATADLIIGLVAGQLARDRRYLCLDLADVSFADCAALRAIVEVHNECLAAGGRLTLTRVGQPLAKLLRLTRLDEALHITDQPLALHAVTRLPVPTGPAGIPVRTEASDTVDATRAQTCEHWRTPCA